MPSTFAQPLATADTSVEALGEATCIVSCGPWFSSATSAAFADAVREAQLAGAREILMDLTGVRAVDAAGTEALARLAEELDERGCELAVASTHPGLVTWLTTSTTGLDLAVHDTIADGLTDLLRRPV